MKKNRVLRFGAIAFGVALLTCAGSAVATAAVVDDDSVDINVEIEEIADGFLALSVEENSTSLTEVTSADPLVREFIGELPTVTVTDTRTTVPDVPWAVLGTASAFVNNADAAVTIGADHLGWTPRLLADYGSEVEAGDDIANVVDESGSTGLGHEDGEFLYLNYDPVGTAAQGTWSATADLNLKVLAASVQPGSYTSVLTLSLFE